MVLVLCQSSGHTISYIYRYIYIRAVEAPEKSSLKLINTHWMIRGASSFFRLLGVEIRKSGSGVCPEGVSVCFANVIGLSTSTLPFDSQIPSVTVRYQCRYSTVHECTKISLLSHIKRLFVIGTDCYIILHRISYLNVGMATVTSSKRITSKLSMTSNK